MSIQQEFINKVYNKDCLEELKVLSDECVDLIITDAPYGDGIGYGRNNKEIMNNEDDSINYAVLPLLYKVLKNNKSCYYFTNWKFANNIRSFAERIGFNTRAELIIVKNNIGMGYGFRNQYEICFVFEKGKATYNLNDFSNVMFMDNILHDENTHPHQKGKNIIRKMIKHSSIEGDLVLDAFAGSGIIPICAKELNRNFIGFEIDINWFNIINNRLSQKGLFESLMEAKENETNRKS